MFRNNYKHIRTVGEDTLKEVLGVKYKCSYALLLQAESEAKERSNVFMREQNERRERKKAMLRECA